MEGKVSRAVTNTMPMYSVHSSNIQYAQTILESKRPLGYMQGLADEPEVVFESWFSESDRCCRPKGDSVAR